MRESAAGAREFLLVQRANPPNAGSWSIPGGKIELGESTIAAGAREIAEEVSLDASDGVRLHPHAIGSSDAIVQDGESGLQFHYVITQLFGFCPADAVARNGDDAASVKLSKLAALTDDRLSKTAWLPVTISAVAPEDVDERLVRVARMKLRR